MGNSQSGSTIGNKNDVSGSEGPISVEGNNTPLGTTIDLNTLCTRYNIPKNMGALNNNKYYDINGTSYTILCSPGNSFSLGTLRGSYTGITINRYNLSSSAAGWSHSLLGRGGGGVEAYANINNVSIHIVSNVILKVIFDVSFGSSNLGGSLDDSVEPGSRSVSVTLVNNEPVYGNEGHNELSIKSTVPIIINASCRASNNWPGSPSEFARAAITITSI